MTLTSWAMLALLALGGALVAGSTAACEIRGRSGCLKEATAAIGALGVGGGLLFTHSPAEGAASALRDFARRRRRSRPAPQGRGPGRVMRDPRDIYGGSRRG